MEESSKRLMILGGTGMNGSKAAEELAKDGIFSELIITYFKGKSKAEELATKLSDSNVKVTTKQVDATDKQSLMEAFKCTDQVVNFIGPFYKYGVDIVKAAIESKINYVDICDDYQVFDEIFKLDESAKENGISVICGFGTSPGFTSLIAMYGASKMDQVIDINIWFFGTPALPYAPAVFDHWFDILEGEVPLWENGQRAKVPAFSGKVTIYAPYFTDKGTDTYITGHPEPVTLPRYIKGVKNVTIRGGYIPSMFMDNIKFAIGAGLTSDKPIRVGENMVSPREFMCSFMSSKLYTNILKNKAIEEGLKTKDIGSRLRVELIGEKDKKNVRYTFDTFSENRETTYLTPVIGAEMLALGKIKTKGVSAVEGIEQPERVLTELFKKGFTFKQELIEITQT